MSNTAFVFMLIGVCAVANRILKLIEAIDR